MEAGSERNSGVRKVDMTPPPAPNHWRIKTAPVMLSTNMATEWNGHLITLILGITAMEITKGRVLTSRDFTHQLMATGENMTARVHLLVLTLPCQLLPTLQCQFEILPRQLLPNLGTMLFHNQFSTGGELIEAHKQSREELSQLRIYWSAMTLRLVPSQSLLLAGSLIIVCF